MSEVVGGAVRGGRPLTDEEYRAARTATSDALLTRKIVCRNPSCKSH